jgi:hypothetical protein
MPALYERGIVFFTTTQRAKGFSTTLAQEPYLPSPFSRGSHTPHPSRRVE